MDPLTINGTTILYFVLKCFSQQNTVWNGIKYEDILSRVVCMLGT